MKILRITSFGYEGGGTENGIVLLQPVLESRGHEVRTLSSDAGPHSPRFNYYAFRAFDSLPGYLKPFYRAFNIDAYRAVRKALKDFKPDIVQIHTMGQTSASVLFAAREYPVVVTVHGAEDFIPKLLLWAYPPSFFKTAQKTVSALTPIGLLHHVYHLTVSQSMYRLGFMFVDRFVVFSRFMQKELQSIGLESAYIPNATKLFAPHPIDPNRHELLFVGRLEKVKGAQDCIEAMPAILKRYPAATLTIAGEGTYAESLKALTKQLGLEHSVRFAGKLSRFQLEHAYQRSTLVLMPSIWPEAFGKVGIEAFSVGRPVIAANVGGISEWLDDGVVGYLVKPESPNEIASRVLSLFGDTSKLYAMAHAARDHAKQFSIEVHADRVIELYTTVIANRAVRKMGRSW